MSGQYSGNNLSSSSGETGEKITHNTNADATYKTWTCVCAFVSVGVSVSDLNLCANQASLPPLSTPSPTSPLKQVVCVCVCVCVGLSVRGRMRINVGRGAQTRWGVSGI